MASETTATAPPTSWPRPSTAGRSQQVPDLPTWPLIALFPLFGAWWAVGLSAFVLPLMGLVMVVLMAVRGRIVVPKGFALWALFMAVALAAAVELNSVGRIVGFVLRVGNYFGAAAVLVYVVNCSRTRTSDRTIITLMLGYLATVVIGGWLGVLFPDGQLTTPTQMLLPGVLADNDYVHALVSPSFAEVQQPWGSPVAFTRPSAPFPYTNGWGCNMALMVPFAAAALVVCGRRGKAVAAILLVLALGPAFATLNRGMFLAITVAVSYAAVRYALRGRFAPLILLGVTSAVVASVALASGVVTQLLIRLQYSQTNIGRSTIYREAYEGALDSPILGHGSPRPSTTLNISIGTQGQLWNVMFSYGFLALAAYVGWFAYVTLRSVRGRTPVLFWMHVVMVLTVLTTVYYGYDGPQLAVAMLAAGLILRPPDRRVTS